MADIGNRHIYLTQEEIDALRTAATAFFYELEETDPKEAKLIMNKGLRSALRKLYKGLGAEKYFDKY